MTFNDFGRPTWIEISPTDLAPRIGTSECELTQSVSDSSRLLAEVARLRAEVNPYADLPYSEDHEVVRRRLDIIETMIPRSEVLRQIEAGSSELALQEMIRRDPSLLAETYASPPEEYICFSEFPIGNGRADFVLLTGRSRMDVIVFELKGADFPIVNSRPPRNFNANVNAAAQQLRARVAHAFRNYESLRRRVHDVRGRIKKGELLYRPFIGPQGPVPEVDPNKDISLYCVLIAGRTVDDLVESKLRHEFEFGATPHLSVESWDSWARKLRRP